MKAMVIHEITRLDKNPAPLDFRTTTVPEPDRGEILIKVTACGVCHTELDEIEGRTPPPKMPVIPGHQVIGQVVGIGEGVTAVQVSDRVGVAWIYSACGHCQHCLRGEENLCPEFKATGRDADGGYAEYMIAQADFVHPIPEVISDAEAAPLLCAGAVGYRALKLANIQDGDKLGLTGFGASNHLVLKMARSLYPQTELFVFARNPGERTFALDLGAVWAGDTGEEAPQKLDAIIDATPVWKPVVEALKNLRPGGRLVINAIRKEEVDKDYLLNLDYSRDLWLEKEIKSVANVTRADVREFLELAAGMAVKPELQEYTLEEANQALLELKTRKIRGAKVLRIG